MQRRVERLFNIDILPNVNKLRKEVFRERVALDKVQEVRPTALALDHSAPKEGWVVHASVPWMCLVLLVRRVGLEGDSRNFNCCCWTAFGCV